MKHVYLLLTVFLYCSLSSTAQTKYWVGLGAVDNWDDAANWSNSSGGPAGADVPNGAGYNVVFDANATVLVDLANISLNSLTVTGNSTVRLHTTAAITTTLNLLSTAVATPALQIDLGSTLEQSTVFTTPDDNNFVVQFGNDAQGLVNGTWSLLGDAGSTSMVSFPGAGSNNLVTVNGTIKLAGEAAYLDCLVPAYLSFSSGSKYSIDRNGGNVPKATWHANATLQYNGIVSGGPAWAGGAGGLTIGNLEINSPGASGSPVAPLPNNLVIQGKFQALNTNGANVILASTSSGPNTTITVQGDVEISPNANITIASTNMANNYTWQVANFVQSGGSFNLRNTSGTAATGITTLRVSGNLTQTGGTFGSPNTTINTTTDLFVVELNGTTNQSVSLSGGSIDNATHQVVLQLNNPGGATLLSPLSVGKINWTGSKGILTTTSTNVLTIQNTDMADNRVVNGAAANGYVSGPVRRMTATTSAVKFPTGKGGVLRECEVQPAATTATVFEAEYFNTAYGGTIQVPLTGVANQYWNIGRIGAGSDAVVKLTLAGALPGIIATDTLVVAHFTGGAWTDARGTTLFPGNSASGSVESELISTFSPFTFGYSSLAALPIYLLEFTARRDGSTAKLHWTITDNSTPQKFEVLRSTNGSSFTAIGTIAGASGKLAYDFTDRALPTGTVYYRLRMIDIDGSSELTKIVAIMNGSKGVVITSMMPTLVTNRARLNISSSEKVGLTLVVTDIFGRSVKQQVHTLTTGNQEYWLELSSLPAGTYQVTGYLATGEKTSTVRFIKQ